MTPKHIIDVLLRCTAGIVVGYALLSFCSIVFTQILVIGWNFPLGDSVLIATMLGHLLYFTFLILCFVLLPIAKFGSLPYAFWLF